MKKLLLSVAVLASLASVLVNAYGQNSTGGTSKKVTPASATAAESPHKIGLIDMGRVFKEYKKFEVLREEWKTEYTANEDNLKTMATAIQKVVEQMKQYKPGSEEFVKLEAQQGQMAAKFETTRKNSQRELVRQEADIYKTVYLETMDVLKKFADHFNYTLIMRFNSEEVEGEDLQKLQIGLNRVIVFHRTEDDLTDGVVGHLNTLYEKGAKSRATPSTTRPAGTPNVTDNKKSKPN